MIYADYAATAGTHVDCVIEAVTSAMLHPGNAGRGAHENSLSAGRILLDARLEVCDFFDVPNPMQVIFTSGITESLNTVIKGILRPNDHVITTWVEHNSVLRPLYEMQDQGVELTITEPSCSSILKHVQENTRMVVMTHGSNVTGDVYEIADIGKFCRERGILFVVDTAQTAGCVDLSMKDDLIDVLCFTGHKGLGGPQGTGGICMRLPLCPWNEIEKKGQNIRIRPLKSGGTGMDSFSRYAPRHFPEALEAGTMNIPGIAGLLAAIQNRKEIGIQKIQAKQQEFEKLFYQKIVKLPEVQIYRDREQKIRTAIIALNIKEMPSALVSDMLEQRFGILTRAGAHCAPLLHEHFQTKEQGMVRFSFGYETTKEEVQECIRAIEILAREASL